MNDRPPRREGEEIDRDQPIDARRPRAPRTPEVRTLGRATSHREALLPRVHPDVLKAIRRDAGSPPPLLLLPLRLEYRVVERGVPVHLASNVAALFAANDEVSIERPDRMHRPPPDRGTHGVPRDEAGDVERAEARRPREWHLDATRVTLRARREIWFRWYPDEDFSLHGVAPISQAESEALARFDEARGGKSWYELDAAAVVSAWQTLSRDVAPDRALHLIRHRDEPGDPNYLDALGRIALLPKRVALFALDAGGAVSLLAEGGAIDPELRYSMANVQEGGWHTDFDAALAAGMGLRLADQAQVKRALDASWIIAVGLSEADGAAAMTGFLDDALANGAFAFLRQDSPTNNTPHEPTPHQSPRADLLAFLRSAADAEKGALASPFTQSAELFAEALGVDLAHVATAPNSGDLALEDARAMLRVVGPALIDTAVDHTASLEGIAEEDIVELFAEAIVARSPLPAVRIGKNPYGILPVVSLESLKPLSSDSATEKRIEAFVRAHARILGGEAEAAADAGVPVLRPGDRDAAATLEAILKLNPVSRRIEVSTIGREDFKALGCPYVTSAAHPADTYLADLAREPITRLPDPTASDSDYPLLYRLARLTFGKAILLAAAEEVGLAGVKLNMREHLTAEESAIVDRATASIASRSLGSLAASPISGFTSGRVKGLQMASGRFLSGVQRLEAIAKEPDGIARLETLLMESIDLFQHRIDAWATGVAYRRLVKRRRAGRAGLVGGYWGMLGRLRADSVTGRTDGYLQAPSPHQAATAAILRSAHLRHRDTGAFAIGLDSSRVRRGLELLDVLQTGISPSEALGYIAERTLHDRHQDILIFRLRDLFPLRDPRDDAAVETRLHDGLAFASADIAAIVPADEVAPLVAVQTALQDHFDALADIVLAEAAHQRASGQAEAANAWLQVLSGETIPGIPSVLRTRRNGHGSSHRLAVLIGPAAAGGGASPREIAEPSLAALLASRLAGFGTAFVDVAIEKAGGGGASDVVRFTLAGDLGLTAMDLLVGGESEVVLRARHRLVERWRTHAGTRVTLGALPERDIVSFINRERPVTIDFNVGATSARSLLREAAELRRAVAQGRRLEPSDLSAAADPSIKLTDALERDLLVGASTVLASRAATLAARLNPHLAALRGATGPVVAAARNCRRLIDLASDAATLGLAVADLESLRPALDAALLAVSYYAEPGALRLMTTADMIADPDELERGLVALAARLSAKVARLVAAAPPATPPANASAGRAQRDALVGALQATLDGEALPILPPVPRIGATTPLLQANPPRVTVALADWRPVRAKVARVATLFESAAWSAFATADASTGADAADADERADEGIAPRARLFGTFVSASDPAAAAAFVGFVADEWAERRPSRMQQTGIAINYDSPQSEPPHVLLLCEPSGPGAREWSREGAAAMVAETIGLMKQRALSAQDRPLAGPLLPFANQVAFKQVRGHASRPRIPVRKFKPLPTGAVVAGGVHADAVFMVDATTRDVGVSGGGAAEISGFSKVKE